jgi:hypothetical protein
MSSLLLQSVSNALLQSGQEAAQAAAVEGGGGGGLGGGMAAGDPPAAAQQPASQSPAGSDLAALFSGLVSALAPPTQLRCSALERLLSA